MLLVLGTVAKKKYRNKREPALAQVMRTQIGTQICFPFHEKKKKKSWHKKDRIVPAVVAKLLAGSLVNPRYSLMS